MDDFVSVRIEGLSELEDALANAGPKLAKAALRKALKAGGEVFLESAKEHCPVAVEGTPQREPGELRDSLTSVVKLSAKEESGTIHVGAEYKQADGNQSPGVYSMFVEFGSIHNPHPKPFLRPAFDSTKDAALEAFTDVLREGVNKLGKKS